MSFKPGDLSDTFDPVCNPPQLAAPDHPLWPAVRAALCSVYDPDMDSMNIYELGLIHAVRINDTAEGAVVEVDMHLTSPACPVAGEMPMWVYGALSAVPGVADSDITVAFDRIWTRDEMAESARIALNL